MLKLAYSAAVQAAYSAVLKLAYSVAVLKLAYSAAVLKLAYTVHTGSAEACIQYSAYSAVLKLAYSAAVLKLAYSAAVLKLAYSAAVWFLYLSGSLRWPTFSSVIITMTSSVLVGMLLRAASSFTASRYFPSTPLTEAQKP